MNRDLPNLTATSSSQLNDAIEAAWNGDHEGAIDLCSEALDADGLSVDARLDFYDARAESYFALGKLDFAGQDAMTMGEIARMREQPELLAYALNRQARVELLFGELDKALNTATAAEESARMTNSKSLWAECLLTLSQVHGHARQAEPAMTAAKKAVYYFQNQGNFVGEGLAYIEFAYAYHNRGDNTESRLAAQKAVDLFQEKGYQYGLSMALNVLVATDPDISHNIVHLNQALLAARNSGYLDVQSLSLANLSIRYAKLGLYQHARRLSQQAIEIARQTGSLSSLGESLPDLAYYDLRLGNLDSTRACLVELEEIAATIHYPRLNLIISGIKGELAEAENDLQGALKYYQQAMFLDNKANEISYLDEIAKVYLLLGESDSALETTSKVIASHGQEALGELALQKHWWHHAQALIANGRENAAEALQKSYRFLVKAISNVSDVGLQRNYLNKLPEHRKIIDAWLEQGQKSNLKPDDLFRHLAGDADERQPFSRLVNTGLLLNELQSEEKLIEFLFEEATELSGAEHVLLILENEESRHLAGWRMPKGEDPQILFDFFGERLDQVRGSRQVLLEMTESPDAPHPSRITAPLLSQNKVLGYLYADMAARYGRFDQTDADMLGMLASQAAVALENLRLVEGLEDQVEKRTAELREANKQAKEARQIAEQANEAKSSFLASMSHELRTPLNAIIGFTRIVKRKLRRTAPEKQLNNLDKVLASAEHLLGLINTVLDLAKIEAGRMDVLPSEYEVEALVEMCLATAQPLARPSVQMVSSVPPDLPTAYSDQDKIRQILLNTLSNAAKFTHEGSITLRVEQQDGLLLYEVIDSGIGMNEEQLARVFEEFQQAESTTSRDYGGTGLGLPISKQLAQLLGGDLVATSIAGEGSTFTLSIPIRLD